MAAFLLLIFSPFTIQTAQAAGEQYSWDNSNFTSLTAIGGNFGTTEIKFAKSSEKNGGATFTAAKAGYQCGTQAKTGQLTITIDADNYKKAFPTAGNLTGAGSSCGFDAPVIGKAGVSNTTGKTTEDTDGCGDQGALTWLFCPVLENISHTVTNIAKDALIPMLKVNRITPETTPDLYKVWGHVRDLANILFIFIFMAIIAGTMLNTDIKFLDAYHIKKTWPRLIIATILVQFSFIFSGLLVDIGNILGGGIGDLLTANLSPGSANLGNLVGNLVTGAVGAAFGVGAVAVLAAWPAAFPLLLSLLISLFVSFLVLGGRFLAIAVLIALSPLAFVAWVLPNTNRYFDHWLKFFFRLIMMYPIIVAVLTLAGIVNQILPFSLDSTSSGTARVAAGLVKTIIAIAAFLMIPASIKLAGDGLGRVGGLISNFGVRGQKSLRRSEMWERGRQARQVRKNNLMGNVMGSKAITSLQGKGETGKLMAGLGVRGAGAMLLGAPSNKMALAASNSKLKNNAYKTLGELDEATPMNLARTLDAFTHGDPAERAKARAQMKLEAPNLFQIASTESGRAAVVRRLADMGMINENAVQNFAYATKTRNPASTSYNVSREYGTMLSEAGKEFSSKPLVLARMSKSQTDYTVKDAAGQAYMTRDAAGNMTPMVINRPVGSLDINTVGKQIRKITGSSFGDKHDVVNFKVMSQRGSKNPQMVQASRDAALAYSLHLDTSAIGKALNPNDRAFNSTPLEVRIEWAKAVAQNHDVFSTHNPKILQQTSAYLTQDEALSDNLAKLAGVNQFDLNGKTTIEKANIANDYIQGKSYDPEHDYNHGGRS